MDALHNNWEAWKSINNSNIITSTLTLYFISLSVLTAIFPGEPGLASVH